jgi:RNA polymerase sigma-70 factor (ECF subfamily)
MECTFRKGVIMTIKEDEVIVREVVAGRTEAFAAIVNRHKDRVYGMIMRLTGNQEIADELAHETFVRAYRRLRSFRAESRFSTWLIQIAINLVRDRIRRDKRNRTVSLDAMLEKDPDAPAFAEARSHYDPLAELSERDLVEAFETALTELPETYREVFVLHHIEGFSYEDIAVATGDSMGSLKVRAHRARKLLKEKLFPEATGATQRTL